MVGKTMVYAVLALAAAHLGEAHIAMWNKGLFGYNYPNAGGDTKQNYDTSNVVAPLRQFDKLTEDKWFAHGMKKYPPKDGDFMELVSGSNYTGELACNRAWTTMGNPAHKRKLPFYACPSVGPLHTANKFNKAPNIDLFGGTAIAIAYTSDIDTVKPTDFTVICTNFSSVWYRETVYQIPPGMPTCPDDGCLCTWNWIHLANHKEGYGNEIYNNLYRCKVSGNTNDTNTLPLGSATVPKKCDTNPDDCVKGPKQPMYVYQLTGNNMYQPTLPPTYNSRYGFTDGAQQNIFVSTGTSKESGAEPQISTGCTGLRGLLGCALALITPKLLLGW